MTGQSNIFSYNEESGKKLVPITNTMIETNHSGERYYNYFEGIIENTTTRVHYSGKMPS